MPANSTAKNTRRERRPAIAKIAKEILLKLCLAKVPRCFDKNLRARAQKRVATILAFMASPSTVRSGLRQGDLLLLLSLLLPVQ